MFKLQNLIGCVSFWILYSVFPESWHVLRTICEIYSIGCGLLFFGILQGLAIVVGIGAAVETLRK